VTESAAPAGDTAAPDLDAAAGIPVIVDDVKSFADFHMTRCTFYGIEASAAVHDWVADLRVRSVPFVLFGLSAALHRPGAGQERFSAAEQVDGLFDAIEDTEGLLVETEHVWIPNDLFTDAGSGSAATPGSGALAGSGKAVDAPARGDVFRVHRELFRRALQFQRGVTGAGRFAEECRTLASSYGRLVESSPAETQVFREWSAAQLRQARDNYQRQKADPDRGVLAWLDEKGEVQPG